MLGAQPTKTRDVCSIAHHRPAKNTVHSIGAHTALSGAELFHLQIFDRSIIYITSDISTSGDFFLKLLSGVKIIICTGIENISASYIQGRHNGTFFNFSKW